MKIISKQIKIIGEKTLFIVSIKNIDRTYKHYPNIKLIIILREPIQRAFSHWNHITNNHKNRLLNKIIIKCIKDDLLKDELDNNEFTNILKRIL